MIEVAKPVTQNSSGGSPPSILRPVGMGDEPEYSQDDLLAKMQALPQNKMSLKGQASMRVIIKELKRRILSPKELRPLFAMYEQLKIEVEKV